MTRLTIGAVIAASLYASVARAGQAEIAAQLNEEGKNLMFEKKFPEASAKFADAVARVPEAKYFFNLCMSRYQEGKFGEALTACNSVEKNGADDALKGKAAKLTDKIKEEAQKQGIALQPTGGGGGETNVATDPNSGGGGETAPDPNGGGGNTTTVATPPPGTGAPPAQPVYAVGRPPEQGLYVSTGPQHGYTWALGFDFFGGFGQVGQPDHYGNAALGFRFKTDIMLMPRPKIGVEGYVQVTQLNQTTMQMVTGSTADSLGIVDLGLAAYKHVCPGRGRFCVTPLAGIQLALMSPASQSQSTYGQVFSYAAAGVRLEGTASVALGRHYEHVLSAQIGANVYSPVFASPSADSGPPASDPTIGLDRGGVAAYLGFGYTYRFNTPLGMMPFVTLE
jgi:hypothetical protein